MGMRVGAGWTLLVVLPTPMSGVSNPALEEPAMFMLPAYDPTAIVIAGIGILAAAGFAFGF
jgi:hypothetical protein